MDLPTPTAYSRFIFNNDDFVVQKTVPTVLLNYLNAQPTVSEVFSGKDLKQCSTFIGTDTSTRTASTLQEFTTEPAVRPVTHTTVSVLTVEVAPSTTTISDAVPESATTPVAAFPASQVAPMLSATDSPGPQQPPNTPPTADQNAASQDAAPTNAQSPASANRSPSQSGQPAQSENPSQQTSGTSQETLGAVNIGGVLGSLLGDIGSSVTEPAAPAQTLVNDNPRPTPSLDLGSQPPDATVFPSPSASTIAPAPVPLPVISLDSLTLTANSDGAFVIGGGTLSPGGPAITVSGTVLSLPAAGTAAPFVLINGVTSSFADNPAPSTAPPLLTVGATTYTPVVSGSATYYSIAPGVTLTPGGAATIDGTRVSLGPDGTVAVVGTSTATLVPASAAASTTGSGVGNYVASGLGYPGPAATGGAVMRAQRLTGWPESCVMGVFAWCLWLM